MNLVVYNFDNKDEVLEAYEHCLIIPRKDEFIEIKDKIYRVKTNPCFNYVKNTVWVFVKVV